MTMQSSIEIGVAGTTVRLLAAKALYWPEAKMLCVADAHFGKAAAFRALGQPVPGGTTAANLARLDAILSSHDVDTLVFLGDLFHARKSLVDAVIGPIAQWRRRNSAVHCVLVRGNHDRRAGALPASLAIDVVAEPHCVGPFALCHECVPSSDGPDGPHPIGGHVHPVYGLRGSAHQRLRLPCFVASSRMTMLPSFGDFTGGYNILPAEGDRVYVTDGSSIWPVR